MVKDAVVDQFREAIGSRPTVARRRPQVRINLRLDRDRATLAIDLSGESLHQRGYRAHGGAAPLKENLAAGLLLRAGWPELAAAGAPLLDPMCGSGTLAIEAGLMAADRAPGLGRDHFERSACDDSRALAQHVAGFIRAGLSGRAQLSLGARLVEKIVALARRRFLGKRRRSRRERQRDQ